MKKQKDFQTKPFGLKDKLGYLLGDVGNDFAFIFATSYLMLFYTKVLGIDASIVGILFLVSRILDAFTDIGMGTLIDKSKPTKDGKFRPWIKRMSGPFAISTFLMYQSSLASAPMSIKIVYMFVTYILWGSIFYTAINIPYGSMASAITEDSTERAALSTFRNLGATVSGLIVGIITPQVIYYADANGNQIINPTNFTIIAGVFSLLSFIAYYSCYKMSTERVKFDVANKDNKKKENVSLFKNLGSLLKNKALISLIASSIIILLAGFVAQSMNQYLFADYFKDINALSAMGVITLPVGLLAAAFSVKLSSKLGKRELSMYSLIFTGLVFVIIYVLKVKNPWLFIALYALSQIGGMLYNMITWANIADVIDYQEILSSKRDDGTIYGLYSFSRKIGQALAGGLAGFTLSAIGYNSLAATQTIAVTNGIYTVSTLVVGILYILAGLVFMLAYPLTKKVIEENTLKLSEMRKSK